MKKLLTLYLILIFCSVFAFAQTTTQSGNWKFFSGINEEFSVEVPESFKLAEPSGPEIDYLNFYKDFSNKTYFFITSHRSKGASRYNQIYRLAVENKSESSDTFVGNNSGKLFIFNDSEGFQQKILAIEGKNRFYMFHTVSETENNPDVERFFASIKFNKNPLEQGKIIKNQNETKLPINSNNGVEKSADKTLNPNDPTLTNQTFGLKLVSNPKPDYTDLARLYGISGKITLRITFLDNRSIGAVTPLTKLPFGLTNNAINAARSIVFEPAMRDGKPFTIVKAAEYYFTIN